jgi:hypothetical protein
MVMGQFGDVISAYGMEDLFEDLKTSELDADQVNSIKSTLNDILTMHDDDDDSDSLLLYIAIVALIAIIGVGAFFLIRSRMRSG